MESLRQPDHQRHALRRDADERDPRAHRSRADQLPGHEEADANPALRAFRGDAWMGEPCRSCERRSVDFGGCRGQAFHFTGDASATDPAFHLSPHHARSPKRATNNLAAR